MKKKDYFKLTDIAILNSNASSIEEFNKLFQSNLFSDINKINDYNLNYNIDNIANNISSRLKNRMSPLSIGICSALDNGPGKNLSENEEITLFTSFGEIDITDKIIKNIIIDKYEHVSPTLFHNSVHHTPLGYYTIIKKINNRCITVSDGLNTNESFINFLKYNSLLEESFVAVHGDEYSAFFDLDKTTEKKKLFPTFISYRIIKSKNNTGFRYISAFDSADELFKSEEFLKSNNIFAGKDIFIKIKDDIKNKKLFTEYPMVFDNPCAVIYRLAMPFYFNIKGLSLVTEKINDKYHLFEVKID